MEDIGKVLAGVVGGVAADEGIRWLTEQRPHDWAENIISETKVVRVFSNGKKEPLKIEFLLNGGWREKYLSSEFIGLRDTGVGAGDLDAWISVSRGPDGTITLRVRSGGPYELEVFYKGEKVEKTTPPNRYEIEVGGK